MWKDISQNLKIETSRPLGKGGFGIVYSGQLNGTQVAVKELKKITDNKQTNNYFLPELEISEKIKQINCDYLVKILDVYPSVAELKANPNMNNTAYIVMELCSGDFRGYLKENRIQKVDITQGIFIIRSIAEAVKALHALDIAHRDIKPDNIFYLKTPQSVVFKLGDFGLGKNQDYTQTQIGTISYMAPEMLGYNAQSYNSKVDIWALGVMAHEILTGVNLFPGMNPPAVRDTIMKFTSYLTKRTEARNSIMLSNDSISQSYRLITRDEVAYLIDAMLCPDPEKRKDIIAICAQLDQVIIALQTPEQPQQYYQQQNQSIQRTPTAPNNSNQKNRVIVMQDNQQAEKLKEKADKFERELLQAQEDNTKLKQQKDEIISKKDAEIMGLKNTLQVAKDDKKIGEDQIKKLEDQIKQLEDEKMKVEAEKRTLEEKIKKLENQINKMKLEFVKLQKIEQLKKVYLPGLIQKSVF